MVIINSLTGIFRVVQLYRGHTFEFYTWSFVRSNTEFIFPSVTLKESSATLPENVQINGNFRHSQTPQTMDRNLTVILPINYIYVTRPHLWTSYGTCYDDESRVIKKFGIYGL